MFRKLFLPIVAIAFIAVASMQADARFANNNYRLRANLTGKVAASGQADYRERLRGKVLEQRFSVEVEDATPGELMSVSINGTVYGVFVINDLGIGELEYRTPEFIDDPGDGDPIPDGFPHLLDGDEITVGPLAGVFEVH